MTPGPARLRRQVFPIDTRRNDTYDAPLSHPPWGGYPQGSTVQSSKADAIRRLNSIEGHLRGIRKMVEEDA